MKAPLHIKYNVNECAAHISKDDGVTISSLCSDKKFEAEMHIVSAVLLYNMKRKRDARGRSSYAYVQKMLKSFRPACIYHQRPVASS
jgi:hypothetical protein